MADFWRKPGRPAFVVHGAKPYLVRIHPSSAEYLRLFWGNGSISVAIEKLVQIERDKAAARRSSAAITAHWGPKN